MPGKLRGCGRGIFGLSSWDPLPRPPHLRDPGSGSRDARPETRVTQPREPRDARPETRVTQPREPRDARPETRVAQPREPRDVRPETRVTQPREPHSSPSSQSISGLQQKPQPTTAGQSSDGPRAGALIIAKHSFTGKEDGPIGKELSFKRTDKLRFKEVCEANEHWWLADSESGDVGYVPATYMHVMEEPKGLPWLQNHEPEPEPEEPKIEQHVSRFGLPDGESAPSASVAYKAYKPTYDMNGEIRGSSKLHCDVCARHFNGEIPYRSHMASKAHKEEVALAELYAT